MRADREAPAANGAARRATVAQRCRLVEPGNLQKVVAAHVVELLFAQIIRASVAVFGGIHEFLFEVIGAARIGMVMMKRASSNRLIPTPKTARCLRMISRATHR